jgi:hypothetical protein
MEPLPMLKKSERRCWVLFADAPADTSMRAANDAFNAFVSEHARGMLLFHDHFGDRPGGVAVFAVKSAAELESLREEGPLAGWTVRRHPLIFADGEIGFLNQVDFSMIAYRGRRLPDLYRRYAESESGRKNAARTTDDRAPH